MGIKGKAAANIKKLRILPYFLLGLKNCLLRLQLQGIAHIPELQVQIHYADLETFPGHLRGHIDSHQRLAHGRGRTEHREYGAAGSTLFFHWSSVPSLTYFVVPLFPVDGTGFAPVSAAFSLAFKSTCCRCSAAVRPSS